MKERKYFEPGIYDISSEEYHNAVGISRSAFLELRRSPKHYWHRYLNPNYVQKIPSKEMRLGTAVHTSILEPDEFSKRYVIEEKIDRRSNAGKKTYEEMLERNHGKDIISKEDHELISNIISTVQSDEECRELVNFGKYEKSFFWIDPDTQLMCKCRPDIMHENFIVDLKTTSNASYEAFQRDFKKYAFHIQFGMMHEAIKHIENRYMKNFINLAIETEEPYAHGIYPISEGTIDQGILEFKQYLFAIKQCLDSNKWPSYKIRVLTLPQYATAGE